MKPEISLPNVLEMSPVGVYDQVVSVWGKVWSEAPREAIGDLEAKAFEVLSEGVSFERNGISFLLKYVSEAEVEDIVAQVARYPQLVPLNVESVKDLTESQLAVGVFGGNEEEKLLLASYLGAEPGTTSEFGYWEMRSSLTIPRFRRNGLNTLLKVVQIVNLSLKSPGLVPLAFTDDIPACGEHAAIKSESLGVNTKLGMIRIMVSDLSPTLKKYLADPCPEGRCLNKGGAVIQGQEACGCSIWVVSPDWSPPSTGVEAVDQLVSQFQKLLQSK